MRLGIPLSNSKTQYFINQAYLSFIYDAGFEPVLVTPLNITDNFDGLILPGGIDIDPIFYGYDNMASFKVDPQRDIFERVLLEGALKKGVPIFGICRGFQLIALEYLRHNPQASEYMQFYQHISNHNQVDDQSLERNIYQHHVNCNTKYLYDTGGFSRIPVNSMHHQCLVAMIKKKKTLVETGFNIVAWTSRGIQQKKNSEDTQEVVVEAFCITGQESKILAVQWHPEELKDTDLLKTFFLSKERKLLKSKDSAVGEQV